MMIIAAFAGAGVLLAVLAMGIEAGRVYLMRNQVQQAGDSAVLALAEQCKGDILGVHNYCDSASQLRTLALRSVMPNPVVADNTVKFVGICVDTGTSSTVSCKGYTDSDSTVGLTDRCAPLPAGSTAYIQLVVERTNAFSGLFLPSSKFRQCVQVRWFIGKWESTPMPFVFPACAYAESATVRIFENPSQGGGSGSRDGEDCEVTWAPGATQQFTYAPKTVSSVDPEDPVYVGKNCGDSVTIQLGSVLTMGELIQETCGSQVASITTWRSSLSNARWVPIAGDYVGNTWNVTVVAFAKFDLLGYNPANSKSWSMRSGFSSPGGCSDPPKLTCVYGRWVQGTLEYAGNSSTIDGIELLQ